MSNQYSIQFDSRFTGFVNNWMRTNYWKVAYRLERDDVMQEAGLVFAKLLNRYSEIKSDAHFMALFKTSFRNRMLDLAARDSLSRKLLPPASQFSYADEDGSEMDIANTIISDTDNLGALHCLVENAPKEVQEVLSLLLKLPGDFSADMSTALKSLWSSDKVYNRDLCALLGKDRNRVNLLKSVESYILGK